ncbi:Potassium channel [Neurospora sp. IMI 360204]|nr:Potassium channel [Neurospora sp. IMI 360204]
MKKTILTIGFGDFAPATTAGRAFLVPFQTFGLLFLGLVISSISRFAANISADKIIKRHQEHSRRSTVGMSVTNENELREKLGLPPKRGASDARGESEGRRALSARRWSLAQYGRLEVAGRLVTFRRHSRAVPDGGSECSPAEAGADANRGENQRQNRTKEEEARQKMLKFDFGNEKGKGVEGNPQEGSGEKTWAQDKRKERRQKLLLLKEDRDRFEAMRQIQDETKRWKQYWALAMAFLAFTVLWGFGAVVFMLTEARISSLSYFDSLYFCWVWLLTIGFVSLFLSLLRLIKTNHQKRYGDITPKSNMGKPFFIVWSLIAVPIVTVLFQEMSSTVVSAVNRGAFKVADWTIMPTSKRELLDKHIQKHPWLKRVIRQKQDAEESADQAAANTEQPTDLTGQAEGPNEQEEEDLPSLLAETIKSIAHDLRFSPRKRYSYEEWQLFTKLIQFTQTEEEVENEGPMTWDWLSENSPLLADITEAEWVLDRLCESLDRYTRSSSHQEAQPPLNYGREGEVTDAELDPLCIEREQGALDDMEEEEDGKRGRGNRDI